MTFNVIPVLIAFIIFNISCWIRHATLKFWNVSTPATLQIKLILAVFFLFFFFCKCCRICQFPVVGYGMHICRSFSNGVTPVNCVLILNGITKSSNARRLFAMEDCRLTLILQNISFLKVLKIGHYCHYNKTIWVLGRAHKSVSSLSCFDLLLRFFCISPRWIANDDFGWFAQSLF